ncbi:MAG: NAD-glutamate dehydrogenase domain-containing protein [Verrucomicrobiota bacterium]
MDNQTVPITGDIGDKTTAAGLDVALLYEAVIELTNEGLLTAVCLNEAVGILVGDLGLPTYFFKNISKDALKNILRVIGRNITREDGKFVLHGELAEVQMDAGRGVRVRIASAETRDRMESLLDVAMIGGRVEYYFGEKHGYHTYLVRPEQCKDLDELKEGESPFAFSRSGSKAAIPEKTRLRYMGFLKRTRGKATPVVETSRCLSTKETRIMFHDDFSHSILPVIRKIMEDSGITLTRAYWETYRGDTGHIESICSLYLKGIPANKALETAVGRVRGLLAMAGNRPLDLLYVKGRLSFEEYVFSANAVAFVHGFICKDLDADREVVNALSRPDLREVMTRRIFESNRNEYTWDTILQAVCSHPELVKQVYGLFDRRFNPARARRTSPSALARKIVDFNRQMEVVFMDDATSRDIFSFMTHLLSDVLKTNFYLPEKRSFAFRMDSGVLDPLVFPSKVHGIFFVAGFYSIGTHLRADDIARGGLRLIRVTPGNYDVQLDQMLPLNYALGPVAQRLKHKDIAESGSKGVIVPAVEYARDGLQAVLDYTEGILDLVQPSPDVVDYLGRPEMVFFGPDEGTAPFMDDVAEYARKRGYKLWRTLTTGKSIGIPHDTHGLTEDGKVFSLVGRGEKGTELLLDGVSKVVSRNMSAVRKEVGSRIATSGMTTASVMASFRTVIKHLGMDEASLNLMMTGGPDGDLGANQIQTFKGRICLLIDGGGILFDPDGLDRDALLDLALARHSSPRLNSMDFPEEKLGPNGFKMPGVAGGFTLPDGTKVDDGVLFHRTFLTRPEIRPLIAKANIQAFIPCGGFRETINSGNVRTFLDIFKELQVIVEGANVFFDDAARRVIATGTDIRQIKDSTANKGGVTCSSMGEVLPAILLGNAYGKTILDDPETQVRLIADMFTSIQRNAVAETRILLALNEKEGVPLFELSVRTSEQMLSLQEKLMEKKDILLPDGSLVQAALKAYVPVTLRKCVGMDRILRTLRRPEFTAYRDAIVTKQLAVTALYRHAGEWDEFLKRLDMDMARTLADLMEAGYKNINPAVKRVLHPLL